MSEWQPIETAPKDGRKILAFGKSVEGSPSICWDDQKPRVKDMLVICWCEGWHDKDIEVSSGLFRKERTLSYSYWWPNPQQFDPTHWLPLPDPPAEERNP